MADQTDTRGASLATSQPAPSQLSSSASSPKGIVAHLTGFLSALAALCTCGPMVLDGSLPTWARAWAAGIVTLTVLPPSISLALIGSIPGAIGAWRGRAP